MKVILSIALLVVSQTMGFSVSKSDEIDWNNVFPEWSDGTLGENDPILRTHQEVPGSKDGKIVGGSEAIPNEFPWVVGLFMATSAGTGFCTGSLISDQYVLTAAHCQIGAAYTDVYLGAHNILAADEPGREVIRATEKIVHGSYNPNNIQNDVALIKLPFPVTLLPNKIQPIALDETFDQHVGKTGYIAGWGRPSDSATAISPVLRKGQSTIITNSVCRITYGAIITNQIICTNSMAPSGTCYGDSGSALWIVENGTPIQVGVTSFVSSAGCESGNPDGFARVAFHRQWIRDNSGV